MVIMKCFVLIGIATLPMLFSLTDDIRCDLDRIEHSLKVKVQGSKMLEQLTQCVQFHSDTKQLSLDFDAPKSII